MSVSYSNKCFLLSLVSLLYSLSSFAKMAYHNKGKTNDYVLKKYLIQDSWFLFHDPCVYFI